MVQVGASALIGERGLVILLIGEHLNFQLLFEIVLIKLVCHHDSRQVIAD